MAEEKGPEETGKTNTAGEQKAPVKVDKKNQKKIQRSQSQYKGTSMKDRVEVEFTQDTNHHEQGEKKMVHPTTAHVFVAKGIAKITKGVAMLVFTLCALASHAQTSTQPIAFTHATDSTITNTDVDTMYAVVQSPLNIYTYAAIQVSISKQSGTLAGTSKLYVSVDGYKWDTLYSDANANGNPAYKYLTLVNQATNTKTWYLTAPYTCVKKFMIVTGGSTTVSAYINAKIIIGKP